MNNFLTVTTFTGASLKVDISDKECLRFGYKHGDRVKHESLGEGTVLGVTPNKCRCICCSGIKRILWVNYDKNKGRASFDHDLSLIKKI